MWLLNRPGGVWWPKTAAHPSDDTQHSLTHPPRAGYLTASRHTEVPSQLLVLGSSFSGAGAWRSQVRGAAASFPTRVRLRQGPPAQLLAPAGSKGACRANARDTRARTRAPSLHTYVQGAHALPGELVNLNTIENFKNADKRALLQQVR